MIIVLLFLESLPITKDLNLHSMVWSSLVILWCVPFYWRKSDFDNAEFAIQYGCLFYQH